MNTVTVLVKDLIPVPVNPEISPNEKYHVNNVRNKQGRPSLLQPTTYKYKIYNVVCTAIHYLP